MSLWPRCTAGECALNLAWSVAFLSFVSQILVVWKETTGTGKNNSYGSEYVKIVIKYRAQPS